MTGLSRFRLRLLRGDRVLDDDDLVAAEDSPLQLIRMNYCSISPEQTHLRDAVAAGAVDKVEEILYRPEHPDGSTSAQSGDFEQLDQTPLYLACLSGHTSVASLLLEAFADVNRDCRKWWLGGRDADYEEDQLRAITPLGAAVVVEDLDICRLLLEGGAEPSKLSG